MSEPSITVTMHPAFWATVLRQVRLGAAQTEGTVKREGWRPSEAAVAMADIDMATAPITEAIRAAVVAHPTWARWFDAPEVGPTPGRSAADFVGGARGYVNTHHVTRVALGDSRDA